MSRRLEGPRRRQVRAGFTGRSAYSVVEGLENRRLLSITPQGGAQPWRLIGITGNLEDPPEEDETLHEIDLAGYRTSVLDGFEGVLPDQTRFPGTTPTVLRAQGEPLAAGESTGALRVEVPNINPAPGAENPYYWGVRSPNVVAPLAAGATSLSFDLTLIGHELNGGRFGDPVEGQTDDSFNGFAQSRSLSIQLPGPNGWTQREFTDDIATDSMGTGAMWSGRDGTRHITWDLTQFTNGGLSLAEYIQQNSATDARIWLVTQGWDSNGNQGPMRFYFDNITLHTPTGDVVVGDFDIGALPTTKLVKLPFVPDTDSIGFNPDNGLLYRASGADSYRNDPERIGYHDNQFLQTIDLNSPAMMQAGVYNANPEGERRGPGGGVPGVPTGPYGLPAPFPTFVSPDHRRTDEETDPSFGGEGPNEYHALRDLTWSDADNAFFGADETGLFKITPAGVVTKIGDPGFGHGGLKGLTFYTVGDERWLLGSERGDDRISTVPAQIWRINPEDGIVIGNPIPITDSVGNPIPGILSLIETPDGELLGIGRSAEDVGNAHMRSLISIDLATGIASQVGTFDQNMADLAAFIPAATPSATRVTQVFVNGPTLTDGSAAFKAAAGVDATFGYAVPGGAAQTTPLSWLGGINSVSIRFDTDVASQLAQADLVVTGSGGPVATTGFTYDAATRTGTWTFAAVTRDKLRFAIDDAGISGLDGEWANPTEAFPGVGGDSYPSGDGTAGGDFNFRVNVLNGDVSGDGQVNATDVAEIKRRLTRRPNDGVTDPLRMYTIFSDVNGDGVINANDLAQVKGRLTQRINTLPDPATAILFA